MLRAVVFARCEECLHAAMQRGAEGAPRACGLCGGAMRQVEAPADLFAGWRCDCYHCVATPC